jgi:hypothetical protein
MITRNILGGKARPVRKNGNLTVICEPTVNKLWELRRLTSYGPPHKGGHQTRTTVTTIMVQIYAYRVGPLEGSTIHNLKAAAVCTAGLQ